MDRAGWSVTAKNVVKSELQSRGWLRATGLLDLHARRAAEPPPETTRLRLARTTSICQAPQYVVEALFEAEGFSDVQFVGEAAATDRTLVSGDAQMGMLFLGPFLLHLDEGAPLLILSGGHVGCLELFAHEPIRSIRDLKGRSVSVVALGSARHVFLATIMAYIGLDPRKDVTIVAHPHREAIRLFEEKQVDAYIAAPPERAGTPREANRPCGGEQQHGPSLVAVFLLRRRWASGVRPEEPGRDETSVARHPERSRHLCARAGACCPIAGEPGARATLRLRTPNHEGCPVRQVARV